ncbi:MAG TPA: hypothetical protein VF086_16620 [Propionibacteriaceae bacterium]
MLTPLSRFQVASHFRWQVPGWRRFSSALLVAVPLTVPMLAWFFLSYDQAAITVGQGISGIPERLLLIEVQGRFVALGWLGYRRATPPSR